MLEFVVGQVPERLIEAADAELPRVEYRDAAGLVVCHFSMFFLSWAELGNSVPTPRLSNYVSDHHAFEKLPRSFV